MKKYKSIIIAFLFVAIHIFIILVLFKKPNIDQDKINTRALNDVEENGMWPCFLVLRIDSPEVTRKPLTGKRRNAQNFFLG